MRQVTQTEYETALRATAAYKAFSAPYVQKNGWTCIPGDATRPMFEGIELTTDAINVHSTNIELFELQRDKPEKFSAYIVLLAATTWTGERVGMVTWRGPQHTNNMGGRWRAITIKTDWGKVYNGREYDSRQFVNFRQTKGG